MLQVTCPCGYTRRVHRDAEPDPSRCPVCGLGNSCAIEARSDVPCWCTSVTISAEALARVPAALAGKACLCPRCAEVAAAVPALAGERA